MKQNLIQDKTFCFAIKIIQLYKSLKYKNEYVLSNQILKSGTSIGANVEEAIAGISKREFGYKMSIALKEARETKYWLRLLEESNLVQVNLEYELKEIEEIINILYKIVKSTFSNFSSQ